MKHIPLIFIDTNIFLDFYRVRGKDAALGLLQHIDDNHNIIIGTMQVEMEFKKNRQRTIAESLKQLEPNWGALSQIPSFLLEAQPAEMVEKSKNEMRKQVKTLRSRIDRMLRNPAQHDPVYQAAQRLFRASNDLQLTRALPERKRIRARAFRRFLMGYPPRKVSDTSYGDAINWEWVIECAAAKTRDVVIVSRDSDYGLMLGGEPILNDWLSQEFRDRVSRKRKITLTDRLAEAFKRASVKVSKAEEKEEEGLIREVSVLPVAEGPTDMNVLRDYLAEVSTMRWRTPPSFDPTKPKGGAG